jgi:hypothetical protein
MRTYADYLVKKYIEWRKKGFAKDKRLFAAGSAHGILAEGFFDVAGQIVLRAVQFRANQTPRVFWQRAELFQRGFNEINFVAHLSATINLNSSFQRKRGFRKN